MLPKERPHDGHELIGSLWFNTNICELWWTKWKLATSFYDSDERLVIWYDLFSQSLSQLHYITSSAVSTARLSSSFSSDLDIQYYPILFNTTIHLSITDHSRNHFAVTQGTTIYLLKDILPLDFIHHVLGSYRGTLLCAMPQDLLYRLPQDHLFPSCKRRQGLGGMRRSHWGSSHDSCCGRLRWSQLQ